MRAFIGATAATLAVLGGAILWQARPISETTAPVAATTIGTVYEGVTPLGGLAEQYRELELSAAAAAAARVTTMGGLAELYAERVPVATAAPVTTIGGMAELYAEQAAAARVTSERDRRMGGMAELY